MFEDWDCHRGSKVKTQLYNCLYEAHIKYKDTCTCRLKVNGWTKIYYAKTNQKKVGLAILISDRAHFRARKVIMGKERHYIMIKVSVLQE